MLRICRRFASSSAITHPSRDSGSFRRLAASTSLMLLTAGTAAADCTCRAGGRDYQLGARVCLEGPGGPRSVVCGMNENVSSWLVDNSPCRISARPTPLPALAHAMAPH
ncbi:hypothetical protein [Ancylobacter radicis]|uniref:Uncharacterized protein n=1 Tax=Ancylobacter radicis TaxID=2836179 RepID=A0ABS5RAS8_9HYPH|nr:hypothetical protein [Ancylobacter radicis]MBS9478612.1 hypothetical protein [Ancylobacter radicis]